ncbi:response regulator [Elusimicrobiota bacterium]
MENKNKKTVILNVDDSGPTRITTTEILKNSGFAVVEASTGNEALELAKKQPDLILLDVKLPDMTGFEVCTKLKSDKGTMRIPVVYLSGVYMDGSSIVKGLEGGAEGYLTRPIEESVLIAYLHVIIREKQARYELLKSEERFRSLIENAPAGIYYTDFDGNLIYANKKLERIIATKHEYLVGKNILDLDPGNENAIAKFSRILALNKLGKSTGPDEFLFTAEDGSSKNVEITTNIISIGGRKAVQGMAQDVTQKRQAELEKEKLINKLADAQHMAAMGKLAGGVAHEINNPLTSILTTAELLVEELEPDTSVANDLNQVIKESKRIRDTIQSFLVFARNREYKYVPNNINKVVDDAIKTVDMEKHINIEVVREYDQALEEIEISRFHIQEVFVSIILNAVQSMGDKGILKIKTESTGDEVMITFLDNGCGIDNKDISRIFEPFFTTQFKKGTGLGLSSSKIIIEQHGGHINISSKGAGKGTKVSIMLVKKR